MMFVDKAISYSTLSAISLIFVAFAIPVYSQVVENNNNSIIIMGNSNSISDGLRSAGKTSSDGKTTAIINRNVNGEKNAIYLGEVNAEGFQIVNNLKSTDDTQYYRFKLSSMGDLDVQILKKANYFNYGIAELGGTKIVSELNQSHITEFFPPGEYMLFVKKYDKPTPYMISIQLKGY